MIQLKPGIQHSPLVFLLFSFLITVTFLIPVRAQEKVTFPAIDSLTVTADFYRSSSDNPYIILAHQSGYSRGAFSITAPRLVKMGYNCLAVDLRSGDQVHYIKNETARLAKKEDWPRDYLDSKKDIAGAIGYAYARSGKPVILLGSSFSASLDLLLAKDDPRVKAVIAFSPGEFFPGIEISNQIAGLDKPLFIATTRQELSYAKQLLAGIDARYYTLFAPSSGEGSHGSKALWPDNPQSEEYWLALMMFINKLKGN